MHTVTHVMLPKYTQKIENHSLNYEIQILRVFPLKHIHNWLHWSIVKLFFLPIQTDRKLTKITLLDDKRIKVLSSHNVIKLSWRFHLIFILLPVTRLVRLTCNVYGIRQTRKIILALNMLNTTKKHWLLVTVTRLVLIWLF